MTIDERLERLAERHEALTQTVEILAQEQREFIARMTQYSADVKDAIRRLANIAAAHDERLDGHESRIEKLEG